MDRLFGTDGVRGVANRDLTAELAVKLGRATAIFLASQSKKKHIVIGRDTRISGDMLQAAVSAGICSAGVDVYLAGVVPTSAVAFLTKSLEAAGGVVISASHNPVEDNGIKFFDNRGYKLSEAQEQRIEAMLRDDFVDLPIGDKVGKIYKIDSAVDKYVDYICSTVDVSLDGLKVVVDCANGAAHSASPKALEKLGAEVMPIFNEPDGTNINVRCGSTNITALCKKVVEHSADIGIAHDGDADRVLAVDSKGKVVNGDKIMAICAKHLKDKGKLPLNTVVATVMSNLGFHEAMKNCGIKTLTTKVGDRYVLEEMIKSGAKLGGEQSGHIIFLEHNTTGDGVLTAVQLLSILKETGRTIEELAGEIPEYPQVLKNVRVSDKNKIMNSEELKLAVAEIKSFLKGEGRVLIRASGTEPIIRVMVEAKGADKLKFAADELVSVVERIDREK
ncbi:phosphoglucosamine mutase [Peptococcaceae bacterium]|nr:phosphoglucosamine mutase [Peptococcaceae bacterium]